MPLVSGTPRMCDVLAPIKKHGLINQDSGGFALGWNYLFNYWFLCPTQVCTWENFKCKMRIKSSFVSCVPGTSNGASSANGLGI